MTVAVDFIAALVGLKPSRRRDKIEPPRRSANPGRDPLKIRGELSKQPEPPLTAAVELEQKRPGRASFGGLTALNIPRRLQRMLTKNSLVRQDLRGNVTDDIKQHGWAYTPGASSFSNCE